MASIITYDVPSEHSAIKTAMFNKGYQDQIPGTENCKIIYFPNTCLYHRSKTPEEARADLKAVCKEHSVTIERCVATIWDNWAAVCGESFKQSKK
jgi:hypothetical protein